MPFMISLRNFIKSLRYRPYQERIRILWITTIAIGILLVIIWRTFLNFSSFSATARPNTETKNKGFFGYLGEKMKDARTGLYRFIGEEPDSPSLLQIREDAIEITMQNFLVDEKNQIVTIDFEIKNASAEILNFLESEPANIQLLDGEKKYPPQAVLTMKQEAFPKRILSNSSILGKMIFPLPNSSTVTIMITDLHFLNSSENKFLKKLTFDLNLKKVRGLFETKLPRE